MMRGRREGCCCKKCSWFGHMAYQCKKKKILEERKKKLTCRGNIFALLLSKVYRRMEREYMMHPIEGEAQPVRY